MAENSKIEWCHHTFNPWIGCTKVGPGCDNCYAEADFGHRRKVVQWGAGQPRKRTAPSTWAMPAKWNSEAERLGIRYRVFCASLADVFDNEVDPSWRADLFHLIEETPNLDWLLVTKRIGNAEKLIRDARLSLVGSTRLLVPEVLPNVWLGATITSQAEADRDVPKLLQTPAAVRFLSMEPLLGPVDLRQAHITKTRLPAWPNSTRVDWVIVGGESGPKARPMHPQWARNIRDQCAAAGVPFLFKQWGEWVPRSDCYHTFEDGKSCADIDPGATKWPCIRLTESGHDGRRLENACDGDSAYMQRVGKTMAGRLLNGMQHDGYPEPSQIKSTTTAAQKMEKAA